MILGAAATGGAATEAAAMSNSCAPKAAGALALRNSIHKEPHDCGQLLLVIIHLNQNVSFTPNCFSQRR
jgi:hypothetical protein